jgi:hypothetical protein
MGCRSSATIGIDGKQLPPKPWWASMAVASVIYLEGKQVHVHDLKVQVE